MEVFEKHKLTDLINIAQNLHKTNDITKYQLQKIVADLTNDSKFRFINDILHRQSIQDKLLLFIKAFYNQQTQLSLAPANSDDNKKNIVSIKSIMTNDSEVQLKTLKSASEMVSFLSQDAQFEEKTIIKQTIFSSEQISQISSESLRKIDIQDFEINFLQLDKTLRLSVINKIFSNIPYFSQLSIDQTKFQKFLQEMSFHYDKHNNPYHNFIHGTVVAHSCYILGKMKASREILSEFDHFILVLSGICHDVGHQGLNNDFEIKTMSKKALRWNDISVLENYHAYKSMKLLLKPENNFLSILRQQDFNYLRKMLISNILATDMKQHHSQMASFQQKLKSTEGFTKSFADVKSVCGLLMHASDFGGSIQKYDTMMAWGQRCMEQFSNQYKQEGLRGVAQTVFMKDLDRQQNQTRNQLGFLCGIVRPIFMQLSWYQKDQKMVKKMVGNVEESIEILNKMIKTQEQKKQKKQQKERKQDIG